MDDEQRDLADPSSVGLAADDSRDVRAKYSSEPLFLQKSDHPSFSLVMSVLTGNNCLTWSV